MYQTHLDLLGKCLNYYRLIIHTKSVMSVFHPNELITPSCTDYLLSTSLGWPNPKHSSVLNSSTSPTKA